MKAITMYVSALNGVFHTAEAALADEDRLPGLIATYEADLAKLVPGGEYGGKTVIDNADWAEMRQGCQSELDRFKRKWAEVQAQRSQG